MKKAGILISVLLFVLGLVGCSNDENVVFQGEIIGISDEAMLIEPLPDYTEGKYADCVKVAIQYMPSSPEPTVGDIIEVTYNGIMQEEDPPWMCGVVSVVIVEDAA